MVVFFHLVIVTITNQNLFFSVNLGASPPFASWLNTNTAHAFLLCCFVLFYSRHRNVLSPLLSSWAFPFPLCTLKTRQNCWEMEDIYEMVVSMTKFLEEGYFS